MEEIKLKKCGRSVSRRHFIEGLGLASGAVALGFAPPLTLAKQRTASAGLAVSDLPVGSAPEPVPLPHFPDRLHAFVWRNWQLVPASQMARVVGAKPDDILRLGRAIGLGKQPSITADQVARSRLTVIRRNWHLLPYEQLLELLGWTPDELEFALREDDFLFIKLGRLKPKCEPLRFQPPDENATSRQREMLATVRQHFPEGVIRGSDPLFGFVRELSKTPSELPARKTSDELRYCYSYFALYGDPLLNPDPDPYPAGLLARLSQSGVTGVWLQGVLHKLTPFPWEPERSEGYRTRLKNLRKLVATAQRHGIRVFIYLNEPRQMPQRFFDKHPDLKGVGDREYSCLCTSVPEVQRYLAGSVESICRAVPKLGGFFTITASENPTNCWSHGRGGQCPRCGNRSAGDVIAEVDRLFAEGIQKSGSTAQLVAWDWGWNDAWAPDAIRKLAPGTLFQSVSEWSLPIERGGIKTSVGEYSISAVGPGPRAKDRWAIAAKSGLKTVAKIQAGNTWELSTVPYIPAVENVARHAANLNQSGVSGLMLGWTLGGYPSPNLEVVSEALAGGSADDAMDRVAERRFGSVLAPMVVNAWRQFSAAFSEYPYHGGVLYNGPQQLGPANLLWPEPTGYHATMTGFPYDDLDGWRAVYPPEVFVQQFEKMAIGFMAALEDLRAGSVGKSGLATPAQRRAFDSECRVAEAAAIHFRSTANQARFIIARRAVVAAKNPEVVSTQKTHIEGLLKDEIALARRLHELQSSDSRFGFEASNQYFYIPSDLAEKVFNCEYLLTHWLPGLSAQA